MQVQQNHINHNIQNDLTVILGLVEIIERENLSERAKLAVKKIKQRIQDASQSIRDVFHPKEEISISELFKDIQDLKVMMNGKDFKMKTNKRKAEMFVDNVVKNAKESGAKSLKIYGTDKKLTIKDDGRGLSKEALEKINSDEIFTTKINGTGLGTQYIKEFCKNHKLMVYYSNNFTSEGCQIEITCQGKND